MRGIRFRIFKCKCHVFDYVTSNIWHLFNFCVCCKCFWIEWEWRLQVFTSMKDLCHDIFGIAKEKKDPREVKSNQGISGCVYDVTLSGLWITWLISKSMLHLYNHSLVWFSLRRSAWCVARKKETQGWWLYIWWCATGTNE